MTRKKAPVKRGAPKKRGATAKKSGTTAKKAGHTHRPKGTKARGRKATVGGLLSSIGTPATASSKKTDKPIIDLEGDEAIALRDLLTTKDKHKTLGSKLKELEGEILPILEEQRLGHNASRQSYIGSVNVRGTGEDEDGNEFDTGLAIFVVQNRYTGFNPEAPSKDEDLQAAYDGEATLRDDAIHGIIEALAEHDSTFDDEDENYDEEEAYEQADSMLKHRMDLTYGISLKEGALALNPDGTPKHPEVIKILTQHLSEWLDKSVVMKPTKDFHERSSYDVREMAIMDKLTEMDLVKRSKPSIKPSTSGKTTTKSAKPVKRGKPKPRGRTRKA